MRIEIRKRAPENHTEPQSGSILSTMTLAHLSDTHLGFQAYGATDDHGFNQREVDVMKTFHEVLLAIEARNPDLVVHAGDLFHKVRPSNATIVKAFELLSKFQLNRAHKPFIVLGGNHDTPRLSDAGSILKLFSSIPGVRVATVKYQVFDLPDLDCEVLAIPHEHHKVEEKIELAPSGRHPNNVLVLHGVEHSLQPEGGADFELREARQERWSYVALGDWHGYKRYGKNICYSGSTDYASNNIWEETKDQKGWIWFDTAIGELEHVPVSTRHVYDCRWIDAAKLDPKDIERQMLQNIGKVSGSNRPIVRQVVTNALPLVRSRIDRAVMREISAQCLHYHLTFWPPLPSDDGDTTYAARTTRTLEQSWNDHLVTAKIPADIDRNDLKELGIKLLEEVKDAPVAPEA
jgi:DNA repair exonuclease SbcCD nuclease subunit